MTIVLGLVGLSFLVVFHEFGHFIVAKLYGVKVETFSLGMGPVLLHHKWGDADFRLSLIPFGGYCGMKGEKDYQKALEENLSEIQGEKDSFYGTHPLKRLLIAFAGPFFNLLFAFIAFFIVALVGYSYYDADTQVRMADTVYEGTESIAHKSGMQDGDIIVSINGKNMDYFTDIAQYIAMHGDEDLTVRINRDNNFFDLIIHSDLDKETGSGKIGVVSSNFDKERFYGPFPVGKAVCEGAFQTAFMLKSVVESVAILFKGINISSAVCGPVRITTLIGDTVSEGFKEGLHSGLVSSLKLLSLISISLFFTNLLPIPILDGGIIVFAFFEFIARKKIHPKVLYYIQIAGLFIIGLIVILAVSSDIRYFISRGNL